MDELDLKILRALQIEPSLPMAELAQRVDDIRFKSVHLLPSIGLG